jgi:peptide/nickel transport system permease protein
LHEKVELSGFLDVQYLGRSLDATNISQILLREQSLTSANIEDSMPPLIRFIISRLFAIPVTMLIVTAALYGFVMLTPVEIRASLYFSEGMDPGRLTEEQLARITDLIVKRYHLNDPYPVQYGYWVVNLLRGDWGYSPSFKENVLQGLLRRSPVTAELALYSLILFIPLGVVQGLVAAGKKDRATDHIFRLSAFIATSLPTFILAIVMMAIFYVALGWFPPERLGIQNSLLVNSDKFHLYTGLLTIDGLLNRRPDISLDALRHLAMPVITLSLLHWATLGRVTRAAALEEIQKQYVVAATARGLSRNRVVWRHVFWNVLSPALTSSALSAASLFSGVFVVEVIYNFKGLSDMVLSARGLPDATPILGFSVYSVLIVLLLMFILDVVQAIFDPRLRQGVVG